VTRVIPLKHLARINERALPATTDPNREIRYVEIGSVGRGELVRQPERMRFADAPSRARRLVREGDTIISTVRTYLRAVWPVSGDAGDLVVSTGFAVLTPTEVDPSYFSWWVLSDAFVEEVVARSVGVSYPAINASELGDLGVRVPSLAEQRAIADYLDTETNHIDTLITKKRRMIELLEERLVHAARALTTSLGHVAPLRRFASAVKTGTTPPARELDDLTGEEISWYSPGDVGTNLEMLAPARGLSRRAVSEGWTPEFQPDTTLIVGIGATAGRVGHNVRASTGNQQMTCITSDSRVLPRFLSWQLWAREEELRETAPYTTLPILNNDFLRSLPISAPPVDHQQDIVNRLDRRADQVQAVTKRLRAQIDLLAERRQALITATVTGDLSVA